jgi:DNA-binding winged helix-turn-helix (wHTH) protein
MTLSLDLDTRELSDGTHSVHLSRQQCQFLSILARAPEGYTSHAVLATQLWPEGAPLDPLAFTKVLVCTVRSRAKAARVPMDITTQWGDGYTLNTPITIISHEQVITIPVALAREIRLMLASHPDGHAVDVLAAMVMI